MKGRRLKNAKGHQKVLEFYKGIGLRLTALNGKKPFLADWYYKELSDEELLEYWAQGYNIGGRWRKKLLDGGYRHRPPSSKQNS
ncbi:hypothetical protein [Caldicellulosiruptor bescii]|uniref:hypothetical protein n=1 Tax=Caldicellulosiruptor bescii TaxID=31899 RepID=UPI000B49D633|nr:hypothetical protein [Caldicellulosiruptor bescii]SMR98655.1 hypothetical protein SAMN05216182_2865 [Caldicellulosiruptor bescii]